LKDRAMPEGDIPSFWDELIFLFIFFFFYKNYFFLDSSIHILILKQVPKN
jgi:hypothetical protein